MVSQKCAPVVLLALTGLHSASSAVSQPFTSNCDPAPSCPGGYVVQPAVDVVILGAGMCGLTAAYTIQQNGKSYVLLEAKNKVGGKMQKSEIFGDDATVEDGANWIGGHSPNPMFDLAEEFDLQVFKQNFEDFSSYNPEGQKIPPGQVTSALYKYYFIADQCLNEAAIAQFEEYQATGNEPVDNGVEDELETCRWTAETAIDDFVTWFNVDYNFHAGPGSTSLAAFPDYTFEDFVNVQGVYDEFFVVDPDGFQKIPEKYAETRLNAPPLLEHEVCEVVHNEMGATVYTHNCKAYPTTKVISTVSPNIYRNRPTLFDPLLPTDQNPFFEGDYQKIYFQFPKVFWDPHQEFINVVYPRDERGRCGWFQNLDFQYTNNNGNQGKGNGELPDNVKDGMWPESKILFCLIITDAVEQVEQEFNKTIDEDIAMTFLDPLKEIFNDYVDPEEIYIPNWNDDPFAGGPIYWDDGYGNEDFDLFFAAGQPTVHISGAHSCRRWGGWTHGAYQAGIRTANIVLQQLGVTGINTSSICDEK